MVAAMTVDEITAIPKPPEARASPKRARYPRHSPTASPDLLGG